MKSGGYMITAIRQSKLTNLQKLTKNCQTILTNGA